MYHEPFDGPSPLARRSFSRLRSLRASLTALAITTALAGCSGDGGSPANLLLVSVDTLRPDRLGCYGDPHARTPFWDRLSRGGAQFRTALAHAPFTLPSHASLLSGEYPFEHLVRSNAMRTFSPGGPTLAEVLRGKGLRTAAFLGSAVLDTTSALDRGFEVWNWQDRKGQLERRADRVVSAALRWLRELDGNEQFFLFVHFYEPHEPYVPSTHWAAVFGDTPYRGEVAVTDRALTRLVRALESRGSLDRTLVVALSDHGEEFGEHGAIGHGFFVYESALRVPLVFAGASGFETAGVRNDVARLIDVAPTILEMLGGASRSWRGRDLRGSSPQAGEVESYGETWWAALELDAGELRSLHRGDWKYIRAPREELYDLARDPGERVNLAASEPDRLQRFRERMADLVQDDEARPRGFEETPDLDEERIAQLEALGYVGGGSLAESRDLSSLPDPKDFATFPEDMRQIEIYLKEKRWEDILPLANGVLSLCPTYPVAMSAKANALVALGRTTEGLATYEDTLERFAHRADLWNDYGFLLLTTGNPDAARRAFRRAVKLQDDYVGARFNLVVAALKSNRPRVAWTELQEVLKRDPDHAQARAMAHDLERAGARMGSGQ